MIGVGINENVYIVDVTVNDKGRLAVKFKEKVPEQKSAFEALSSASGEVENEVNDMTLQMLSFNVPTDTDKYKWSAEDRINRINADITLMRNRLTHILEGYMNSNDIKWSLWANTGITAENYSERIQDSNVLQVVYSNICNQFIEQIKPFANKSDKLFRVKLVRQSESKHYATWPSSNYPFSKQPFFEPMEVPKEASKVAFTDYEKKNKLDDSTPVSKSTADAKDSSAPDQSFGQTSVFGSR